MAKQSLKPKKPAKKAEGKTKPKKVQEPKVAAVPVEASPKVGRPSSYKPEFSAQAEKLCRLGATIFDLANFFDVTTRTIDRWIAGNDEFCRAVKMGSEPADDRVERSLYHRAVGYSFESEKVFQFQGQIVRANTVEHVAPETTAAIFWLKNRRKDKWRDIRQHEVGEVGDFDDMSADELRDFIREEAKELGLGNAPAKNSRRTRVTH